MPIDRADFAEECIRQGLYCGTNPHYLLGIAQLRSGIADGVINGPVGPFRLTQAEWNAHCTDTEFDFYFLPEYINKWRRQVPVFSLMAHRAFDAFVLSNNRNPTAKELYLAQWPGEQSATLSADLKQAFDATAALLGPAADAVLDDPVTTPARVSNPDQQPSGPPPGALKLAGIRGAAKKEMAQKIIDAFAAAGLGKYQQAAAVANAIAESNLDPTAHAAVGEDSWGLFQLNRRGGEGAGHNPAELMDPDRNIAITLGKLLHFSEFTKAPSLEVAVSAFVRDFEKPRDISGQIRTRLAIAQKLV